VLPAVGHFHQPCCGSRLDLNGQPIPNIPPIDLSKLSGRYYVDSIIRHHAPTIIMIHFVNISKADRKGRAKLTGTIEISSTNPSVNSVTTTTWCIVGLLGWDRWTQPRRFRDAIFRDPKVSLSAYRTSPRSHDLNDVRIWLNLPPNYHTNYVMRPVSRAEYLDDLDVLEKVQARAVAARNRVADHCTAGPACACDTSKNHSAETALPFMSSTPLHQPPLLVGTSVGR